MTDRAGSTCCKHLNEPFECKDCRAESRLQDVARAIKALEGLPVEYGLARKLSDVMSYIRASSTDNGQE